MSWKSSDPGKMNRRNVIKNLGLGVTGISSMSFISRANEVKSHRQKHLDISHEILKRTGSVEKQHKYLKNNGFSTTYDKTVQKMPIAPPSGDIGEQTNIKKGDLHANLSLFNDCTEDEYADGTYTAELSWEYKDTIILSTQDYTPADILGIGFSSPRWDYENGNKFDDLYTTGNSIDSGNIQYRGGSSDSGPAFDVTEQAIAGDGPHYAGVHLKPVGDYTTNEREIEAGYTHLWSSVGINGVTVGKSGLSVAVTDSTKSWSTDTEPDGDFLRVSQNDAVSCRPYS